MIATMIALAAAPAADCTSTRSQPVCAHQSSARGITVKMLPGSNQARCGQIRLLRPGQDSAILQAFTPRFPITTVTYSAAARRRPSCNKAR